MTAADAPRFEASFNNLAIALRESVDAVQKRIYFDKLADLPVEAVVAAAERLAVTQVSADGERSFFPTTAQWHLAAKQAWEEHTQKALLPPPRRDWHYDCEECGDVGWRYHVCTPDHRCGRSFCASSQTYTHSYGSACPCRSWNPTYKRHHPTPMPLTQDEAIAGTERVRRGGVSRVGG